MVHVRKAKQKAPCGSRVMLRWMPCQRNSWEHYLEVAYPGTAISWHAPLLLLAPQNSVLCLDKQYNIWLQFQQERSHAEERTGWACFPLRHPIAERDQASTARATPRMARICSAICGWSLLSTPESPALVLSTCPGAASHTCVRRKGCNGNLGGIWWWRSLTHHHNS